MYIYIFFLAMLWQSLPRGQNDWKARSICAFTQRVSISDAYPRPLAMPWKVTAWEGRSKAEVSHQQTGMRRWNKQINISTVQFQDLRHKRTSSETQEHISSNVSLPSHCSCKSFVLLIPCLSNLGFLEVTIPSTSCRVDTSIIPPCSKQASRLSRLQHVHIPFGKRIGMHPRQNTGLH